MGTGFTDEKRHWCNVQIPVRQHYLPLNAGGPRSPSFGHRVVAHGARAADQGRRTHAGVREEGARGVHPGKAAPAVKEEQAD